MALVDYSSSDGDQEAVVDRQPAATSPKQKRKRDDESTPDLPPLPSRFHDLYASTARASTRDDPNLHGGRKRATPHIEGNWPTHIYVEWYPSTTEYSHLNKLISALRGGISSHVHAVEIHSFLTSDLNTPLPLHISLSRPIGLATSQKDAFSEALDQAFKSSGIPPFEVALSGLDWVSNFEHTRWFLVLRLQVPNANGLNKLLHVTNNVVQVYNQPTLYAQGSPLQSISTKAQGTHRKPLPKYDWDMLEDSSDAFHISLAWTLKAPSSELLELTQSSGKRHLEELGEARIQIAEVKSKVGNVVTNLPLSKNVESRNLFGI